MLILLAVVVVLCMYCLFWVKNAHSIDRATACLPALPTLPIIGNAMLFVGNTEKILKNLEEIASLAFKSDKAVKIWLGPKLYIAMCNPEDAQVVLENCLDKDVVYRFLRPWLGQGLFIAPLGLWKIHRKVLIPVFHNKIIEEYLGVIAEQADILIERLKQQSGQEKFDVLRYITACTLDIVFETSMGEKMDVQRSPDSPYIRARHIVMEILSKRMFKVWLQPDCLFNLTKYSKEQKENIKLTHTFTDEVVRKRRLQYEAQKGTGVNGKNTSSVKLGSHNTAIYSLDIDGQADSEIVVIGFRFYPLGGQTKSVLDMLFEREIEFTDGQLREHIDSITIAGNDTTALVIAYTIMLLGIHQDAQERVFQEQQLIFGKDKEVTKENLQQMHYLERVIKESMRLYSVVPIIARNIHTDIYLPHSKVTLPAGVGAVVGSFAIHRSVQVWGENADDFDPDRFLPECSVERHPAAFLPFSYGARNCIGRNFGMIIMKVIVSRVIRSYKIEADEVGPLKIEMLLFPTKGHQIKITKRGQIKN